MVSRGHVVMVSRSCFDGVPVVLGRCPGHVLMVSRSCCDGVLVMFWRCAGYVLMVTWSFGGVPVIF